MTPLPAARDIDLWSLALDASPATVAALAALLSEEERERAERFAFAHLRRRFIVRRGALRLLLGHYTGMEAGSIVFRHAGRGKPLVDGAPHFSASHSGDLAIYAFTNASEIGIDVERIRGVEDAEGIAKRFFAPEELTQIAALRAEERDHAFLKLWTRKEAYLKATGDGLSGSPDALSVLLDESTWRIHELTPADGFIGALAIRNCDAAHGPWRHLSSSDLSRNRAISPVMDASSFHHTK